MQRRKPGSWAALVTPEGSASGHVWMEHICIPGEGQPVHLAHITLPSPPTLISIAVSRVHSDQFIPKGVYCMEGLWFTGSLGGPSDQVWTLS